MKDQPRRQSPGDRAVELARLEFRRRYANRSISPEIGRRLTLSASLLDRESKTWVVNVLLFDRDPSEYHGGLADDMNSPRPKTLVEITVPPDGQVELKEVSALPW